MTLGEETTMAPAIAEAQAADTLNVVSARIGVTAIFFANGLAIGAWAVAIPEIKALFGLTDGGLSMILLAAGVGGLAAMPIAGVLPPRLGGTGRTLRISGPLVAILLAALPLLHAVSEAMAALLAIAFLFGVVNILMDVPMNAHASVIEARWGRAIMSSFHAAWSGGGLVGSMVGGLLLAHGAGVTVQLGIEAAIVLTVGFAATFWIGVGDTHAGGHALAWPERRLVALGLIALLAVFSEGSVTDWSALYLKAETGLSPGAAAAGFSAYALMMFLGRLGGDAAVRGVGRKRVIVIGSGLLFVGAAIAVVIPTAAAGIAGFCLIGLGVSNIVPAAFSESAAAASSPSLGIAMTASMAYTALLAGPPLFGMVASFASLRASYGLLLFAAVIIVALTLAQPNSTRSGG
jgi:MFS family permease